MKKKLILCLGAIFSLIFCFFALTGCSNNLGNQDAAVAQFVQGTTPYETLKTFVTNFPKRASVQNFGEDNSKQAASWIAEQFKSFGYTTPFNEGGENEGLDVFTYENSRTSTTEIGYNVVFKKESASNKTVVIGANYDNVYGFNLNGQAIVADGTYGNGVGVATLIETAKALKDINLPFDVEFVAFCAKEEGFVGSQRFLENHIDKENIILMINFDRNAIGDYVYMYSSEAKTKHNQFFYDIAKENNLCIAELPNYRSPSSESVQNNSISSNEANWADSQVFLVNEINVVSFISMNFGRFEATESAVRNNILYTQNDNFASVVEMLGGEEQANALIDKQINSVVSAVVYAFKAENFVDVMSKSKANNGLDAFASSIVMYSVGGGLIVFSIVVIIILYFVFRKSAKPHDVYVQTIYGRMNTSTGKIEGFEPKNPNDIGNIFGSEFKQTPNDNEKNEGQSIGNNSNNNEDKTTDIFGDF